MKRTILLVLILALALATRVTNADFTFGIPTNLEPEGWPDGSACISADGLELYSVSCWERSGNWDIWVATRETTEEEWSEPSNLGELVNSNVEDSNPMLSADGLELYFNSFRPDGLGGTDLWVTTRATKSDPWGPAVNLGPPVNSTKHESAPSISADGLELYLSFSDPCLPNDDPAQGFYVARRETIDAPWGEPVSLGAVVNSWPVQWEAEISSDGLLLLWADYWNGNPRPGGFGDTDLWFSRRATKDGEWSESVNLGPAINTTYAETGPAISADGSTLYFSSNRFSASHCYIHYYLYQAPILPVVDFDGDGIVEINDLITLIERWGTDDPQCDIGPMPWGDGTVDDADLEVLMDYWGQDMNAPPEPVAHWKLDEAEGTTVHDSAGTNDAILVGDPVWQPVGGQMDGALELDGVDDGVEAGFVLDPRDGPFSAFAWVKGGGPGQVIISQAKGTGYSKCVNWLMTDPVGNLMTEFKCLDENYVGSTDLVSWTQITDGPWHHVGLVWDSFGTRILYVDEVEVAKNTVRTGFLDWQNGGINIGFQASVLHLPTSDVWFGQIDDVRIYNRALNPEQIEALVH